MSYLIFHFMVSSSKRDLVYSRANALKNGDWLFIFISELFVKWFLLYIIMFGVFIGKK